MEQVSQTGCHGAKSLPSHGAMQGLEEQIDGLRKVGRYFFQRGWSVGTSSNYSVIIQQQPLQLLLTASGMDKGQLKADDFVRVNDQGQQVDAAGNLTDDQPKSSAETLLHVVAAQQLPDVGVVLHTHSPWVTVLSDYFHQQNGIVLEGYEMLKGLSGIGTHETRHWVPIFENTQDIAALAKDVAAMMQDTESENQLTHGYLIRRHGLYTWGKDLAEARRHIEIYEFLFEVLARKMMLEGVMPATP
ncbi:MAG: methylthioribulose 1-phosphate dehydratase [Pirellulales bacterium]